MTFARTNAALVALISVFTHSVLTGQVLAQENPTLTASRPVSFNIRQYPHLAYGQ